MLVGLFFGFAFFIGMMLGDCLPRDGSAAMHACDNSKDLGFRTYPFLLLAGFMAGGFVAWRRPGIGSALAAAAPFLALGIIILLERVLP